MESAKLSSKGQVVVPKSVRKALQANPGAQLGFDITGDKAVIYVLRKKTASVEDGYGMAHYTGEKIALEDWDNLMGKSMRGES